MGWLILIGFALLTGGLLWRLGRFDTVAAQLLGAALLFALAGYAWQGRPTLAGAPKPAAAVEEVPESAFADMREDLFGRFGGASSWLTIAESYQRRGNSRAAVGIIRSGLRRSPDDAVLWVGLGNALVIHAEGLMTPAAQLAFQRAARLAPDHPGPPFFYGLSLAQGGRFDEAETVWRELAATAPEDSPWREAVEERLEMIARARAAGQLP